MLESTQQIVVVNPHTPDNRRPNTSEGHDPEIQAFHKNKILQNLAASPNPTCCDITTIGGKVAFAYRLLRKHSSRVTNGWMGENTGQSKTP
jgi:hypothetical protein